jgi:hypothetical protein
MRLVTTRVPDDEMETPRFGSLVGATIFYSVPPALFGLAVWNLVRVRELPISATVASVIWIVFTLWYVWMSVSMDGGFQRWAIARLGQFGMRYFVWIDRVEGELPRISTGFRLGQRRFLNDSFVVTELRNVSWNHGQASAMSQHELADWSTTMRFQPSEPRSNWWSDTFRGQCGFGFCGEKARIAAFGESLVAFLRRAGVEFEALPDGCGYQVVGPTAVEGKAADDLP